MNENNRGRIGKMQNQLIGISSIMARSRYWNTKIQGSLVYLFIRCDISSNENTGAICSHIQGN